MLREHFEKLWLDENRNTQQPLQNLQCKTMMAFNILWIPSTCFSTSSLAWGLSSCLQHDAAKFLTFSLKICSNWGGLHNTTWLFNHGPLSYVILRLPTRMKPANKALSLGAQQNIADRGRSCCYSHAIHMCSMVTVRSLITAMLFYSCHASCFSIAFHNNRILWHHEWLST